jgi:hypothetical protein
MLHFLRVAASFWTPKSSFTLYFSLFSANLKSGDRFDVDWLRHQAVRSLRRFPGNARIAPDWPAFGRPLGLYNWSIGFRCPFRCFCLLASKSRFPATETIDRGDSVRMDVEITCRSSARAVILGFHANKARVIF